MEINWLNFPFFHLCVMSKLCFVNMLNWSLISKSQEANCCCKETISLAEANVAQASVLNPFWPIGVMQGPLLRY